MSETYSYSLSSSTYMKSHMGDHHTTYDNINFKKRIVSQHKNRVNITPKEVCCILKKT